MPTQGPFLGTSFSGAGWTNPSYLAANDGANATKSGTGNTGKLFATGFGFSIPTGAIIDLVTAGVEYYASATDIESGADGGVTYDGSNGSLPLWSASGGVPTSPTLMQPGSSSPSVAQINSSNFGVYFNGSAGSGSKTFYVDYMFMTVTYHCPTPAISTTSLPNATNGLAYSQTLSGTSASGTWSIVSGALPTGLSLASSTGIISGTSSGAGTSFTVRLTNTSCDSAYVDKALSITTQSTKTLTSTSTGSQNFTKSTTTQPYFLANNNQAYVLNVNTGSWTFIDNHPFTSMIYRPLFRTVLGARRDEGDICTINSGDLFDLTAISWSFQTGYMNFGQLDEVKEMPPNASESLKRVRALFSEVKAGGNITLTVYTENDSTGKTFTITPATTDNTVYNMVRTALSRDIRGKYVSFKFSGTVDAWIGETGLKIAPRNVR